LRKSSNVLFETLANDYWEKKGRRLKMKGLDYMLEAWKKRFGMVRVRNITKAHLEDYFGDMLDSGKSPGTVNRHIGQLHSLFTFAVERGHLAKNPANGISKTPESARMRYATEDEIARLLEACRKPTRKHLLPIVQAALFTGMRKGELFTLKLADVNLDAGFIHIRDPKEGRDRVVPISPGLKAVLESLPMDGEYVFKSPKSDKALTDIGKSFRAALADAEIRDFRFHDLRHTFASHLVMANKSLKVVQELLGHSSLRMTMKYAHLSPAVKADAVSWMDGVLEAGKI